MGRDHRVADNWGLLAAQASAHANNVPLIVAFTLVPTYLGATRRQYGFMLRGLREVEEELSRLDIPFILPVGQPDALITDLVKTLNIGLVVTDFLPLKIISHWKKQVAEQIQVPFIEVDAHNIVPPWVASQKQEVGAYTLRPKLARLRELYLEEFPVMSRQRVPWPHEHNPVDWENAWASISVNESIKEVDWIVPGESAAQKTLHRFVATALHGYAENRNLPELHAQSDLSPYLHYGHISPHRVALEVIKADAPVLDREAFLEELVVRRELSENNCLYNKNYDRVEGAPNWAQQSLQMHADDPREFLYTLAQLECAATHDPLWNAAQTEMVRRGKMHGYMRMYWAKKILEWSHSPSEALSHAILLNDKYFLDGRDPNGYTGILWSIAGLHDRPWFERPVFGKIRYMNYNGAKRKFNIQAYVDYVNAIS